jgi:UDP-N-acetylglucosamine transferase subunit ALG13
MIFNTVGSALPFDRLVRMLDRLAEVGAIPGEAFAQIGEGKYIPRYMPFARFLPHTEYEACFRAASGVVSHAGIGTIATAMRAGKPLLVLPRSPALGEVVDNHQLRTAQTFSELGHILMFTGAEQLSEHLAELLRFVPRPRRPNVEGVARAVAQHLMALTPAKVDPSVAIAQPRLP